MSLLFASSLLVSSLSPVILFGLILLFELHFVMISRSCLWKSRTQVLYAARCIYASVHAQLRLRLLHAQAAVSPPLISLAVRRLIAFWPTCIVQGHRPSPVGYILNPMVLNSKTDVSFLRQQKNQTAYRMYKNLGP